jgi:CelD/BcsL family acetyltransferase involved in cellulose biosynthesis
MDLQEALRDAKVMSLWESAVNPDGNLYAMYHSVVWLRTGAALGQRSCQIHVKTAAGSDQVIAIAATARVKASLRYEISRTVQHSARFDAVELLAGQVIGDQGRQTLEEMIAAIWSSYPDVAAIFIKSIAADTSLWKLMDQMQWRVGSARAYKPHGNRPFHYAALPATFDDYLAQFPSKQRYNLRKKVKRMADAFSGQLSVRRVADATDIDYLVASATYVSERSWRAQRLARAVPDSIENRGLLTGLAAAGLLRSFVLEAGGHPCAFIVGYLYEGVFHYADLAYVEDLSAHSPGTVLLFLATEALVGNDSVKYINYGITDAQYKQVFGNRHIEEAELLIVRPTVTNACRVGTHALFRDLKQFAKKLVSRR